MTEKFKKFMLLDGTFIRYKVEGKGQPVLLFHTIRNRLEYSEKVVDILKKFSIYLVDLPDLEILQSIKIPTIIKIFLQKVWYN